jgi:glycosyltransferase involved in cell wall biosynthesis
VRIFIGPFEISGFAKGLCKGFNELGMNAQVVLSIKHPFGYGGETNNFFTRTWQFLGKMRGISERLYVLNVLTIFLHKAWGFLVFLWTLFTFDTFIFLFGKTLTDTKLELIILRCLRKKIIFINFGSDIRPPYMNGKFSSEADDYVNLKRIAKLTKKIKNRSKLHERYADFIVAQPSNAHFYEKPFINWFSIGAPIDFEMNVVNRNEKALNLRVVHSPSDPIIKGTDTILSVIQKLIDEGLPLELVCLNEVSNQEVLKQLQQCDFVVDQLYSDIPMAVFGAEAALFSKPSIIAGYLVGSVESYIPENNLPPSLYVLPDDLREAVRLLVCDENFRLNLGFRAHKFVSQHWGCKVVAERYLMLLNGMHQPEWWFNPAKITYTGGCGVRQTHIAKVLSLLLQFYGKEVLQVGDKPDLEQALVNLAGHLDRRYDSA